MENLEKEVCHKCCDSDEYVKTLGKFGITAIICFFTMVDILIITQTICYLLK